MLLASDKQCPVKMQVSLKSTRQVIQKKNFQCHRVKRIEIMVENTTLLVGDARIKT